MNFHTMKLAPEPFASMASGTKKSELRLNDKKRQQVKIGDSIEFTNTANEQDKVTVKVTYLNTYKTFADTFEGVKQDYSNWEKELFVKAMYDYYTPEDEAKYGTLEIGVSQISQEKLSGLMLKESLKDLSVLNEIIITKKSSGI